jgi:hypothetical protein
LDFLADHFTLAFLIRFEFGESEGLSADRDRARIQIKQAELLQFLAHRTMP